MFDYLDQQPVSSLRVFQMEVQYLCEAIISTVCLFGKRETSCDWLCSLRLCVCVSVYVLRYVRTTSCQVGCSRRLSALATY